MLELALKGCHNIELVTPTPQLPAVLESLLAACEWGLQLPLIYNCGGYERTEVIRLLYGSPLRRSYTSGMRQGMRI